jgi:hypothetical protein
VGMWGGGRMMEELNLRYIVSTYINITMYHPKYIKMLIKKIFI